MLINCVDLTEEIERYVPLLQATSGEEIIRRGWRYDPPKALSDVFESIMGAVLVDSGYNYERAAAIVEFVMQDVLVALSPSLSRDPVSELMEWGAGLGCTNITFG
jgi:endoribonuclease Dicer